MARSDYHGVNEQRKAAFKRLRDAQTLLAEHDSDEWRRSRGAHARGAMYLECRLKAVAMEVYRCRTLAQLARHWNVDERVIYNHGLKSLAERLPFWSRLVRGGVYKDFTRVIVWRPSWRYDPEDHSNEAAARFLESVQRVYDWLDNNQ